MVASLRGQGGLHSLEDFATTRCEFGAPISGNYKEFEIVEHPPNGQGAAALLAANIISQFNLEALEPFEAERAHLEAEAVKLAMDARDRFIADPEYTEHLEHMLSMETARALAALIKPGEAMRFPRDASNAVHKETVYVCVRRQGANGRFHDLFNLPQLRFGLCFDEIRHQFSKPGSGL